MSLVGVGTHQMWGLSPAIDCLEVGKSVLAEGDSSEPISILLISCADIRHVLKTIAQRRSHEFGSRPIHFYIHDSPNEVLARHLLLLQIAHDFDLPIRLRCNTFLEVFANALVQDRTARYIEQKGKELVSLVCDNKGALADIVDTSLLKFREVDSLQEIFEGWAYKAKYDLETLRDYRLRHLYGTRYDFRKNVLDWDYQMMVKPVCGNIHILHYREWRQSGVAFEFGDQTYTAPNRTMATYAQGKERGLTKLRLGFWLDIVNSPYWALGTACKTNSKLDEELFRVDNLGGGTEQWRHTAVEMSAFNILSFLHQVEHDTPYTMRAKNQVYSGLGGFDEKPLEASTSGDQEQKPAVEDKAGVEESKGVVVEEVEDAPEVPPEAAAESTGAHTPSAEVLAERERQRMKQKEAQEASIEARHRAQAIKRATCIMESYSNVKVFPVGGSVADVKRKRRYRGLFDMVVVSNHGAQHIKDDLAPVLKPRAVVVTELGRGMVTLKTEQQKAFQDKVNEHCRGIGCYFEGHDKDVSSDTFSIGSGVSLNKPGSTRDQLKASVLANRKPQYSVYVWEADKAEERKASWARIEEMAQRQREAEERKTAAENE